jgi:hypothetical protein
MSGLRSALGIIQAPWPDENARAAGADEAIAAQAKIATPTAFMCSVVARVIKFCKIVGQSSTVISFLTESMGVRRSSTRHYGSAITGDLLGN